MDFQHMKQRVIELARKYHYPEIIDHLQPSIRMKTVPRREDFIALGESKIGGLPDLPRDLNWPEWKGISLPFIAQVHLPDIANYEVNMLLSRTGILYFFFDIDLYFSSPTSSSWQVLYFDGDLAQLHRTSAPHPAPMPQEEIVMPSCVVEFSPEITIPPFSSLYTKHIPLETDYFDLLKEVEHLYDKSHRPAIHRMFGHPNAIQNDMQVECQERWNQKYDEVLSKQAFEEEAKRWLLLLQISWDEHIERDWADSGKLYYWIRPEDLEARRFGQVQFIHQCY